MNKNSFFHHRTVSLIWQILRSANRKILLFGFVILALKACAGTAVWTGNVDTNWSNGGNWSGGSGTSGAPASTDDVLFGDVGNATNAAAIGNVVDDTSGNFQGTISSLSYTNSISSSFQNTLIAPGLTLTLTNNTGPFGSALFAGTPTAGAANTTATAIISGSAGATLFVNNTNAVISISRSGGSSALCVLNLMNLDNFVGNINKIAIGDFLYGVGTIAAQGAFYLAKTNLITTAWIGSHGSPYSTSAQPTNAIQLGVGSSSTLGGINALYLGLTNGIFTDTIGVGGVKSGGSTTTASTIAFAPAFTNSNPTAYFRGAGGNNSRIFLWGIGDTAINSSSSAAAWGKVDLSGGTVDALVDNLILGRDRTGSAAQDGGSFTFTAGNVNVNTLIVGDQGSSTSPGSAISGTMTVGGNNATLTVNTNLELGHTTLTGDVTSALNTRGVLNIFGGTVNANNISVGAGSTTNIITMNGATLAIANSLTTNASGLFALGMTNSVLGLNITDNSLKGLVQTLTTGGATNVIQLASVPVFDPSFYPGQFPLIKFTTLVGAGFNVGLTNVPATAPGAYLTNNVVNNSIDLVLPVSPAPVITSQPQPFSGGPNSLVTLSVASMGNEPLSYQWYYTNSGPTILLSAGAGESGTSTLAGATTNTLAITGAQDGDSGGYFVVITNIFGAITSTVARVTVSSGAIQPGITELNNQTNIAGTTATISASVSGNPFPLLRWQFNGSNLSDGATGNGDTISGSSASTLNIANVQYPSSQGTYSLIASNSAGVVTNSMFLTIIVTPAITNQPTSLVVTNTQNASFSVMAGGVPDPTFQWYKNSLANPIGGATGSTLNIASASPNDTASYFVVVANAAGSVTSSNVTLTVNSTMTAIALSPTNSGVGICYDTPLVVTFDQMSMLNNIGMIKIYNVTNSSTPVDTLNLALGNPQTRTIGGVSLNAYPVIINGNTANIYPHSGVMTSNQTYYVTIDDGAFKDSAGAYFSGITATNAWQFTTKAAGPANPTNLVVATDGSGDFATVQGAMDFIPNGNTAHVMVNIRDGIYREITRLNSKNNVTFRGQDRHQTIVVYANNDNINGGTSARPMFGVLGANDIAIENLTLTNSTPKGGSQAEALFINGCKRFILLNADLDSFQDTLLCNANGDLDYFQDDHIQGDTDFIWGGGTAFFTNCEIETLTSGTANYENITQPRTVAGTNGLSFVNCRLTRLNGSIINGGLGRSLGFTDGNAAYINCLIDAHIVGWQDPQPRYWEFENSNITATAAAVFNGTQLIATDPNLTNAETAILWLYGWQPQLAPNIISEPVDTTATAGQSVVLTVNATGISAPGYQWLKNGTNAPYLDANIATLTIPNAQTDDAGDYSVIVSNAAGTVTSTIAHLTVLTPTSPTVSGVTQLNNGSFQFTIAGGQAQSYRVWASTNIALRPVTETWMLLTNATFSASPALFTDSQASNFPQRFYIITVP